MYGTVEVAIVKVCRVSSHDIHIVSDNDNNLQSSIFNRAQCSCAET